MGSFPFGLIATAIGAPWTVVACGILTVVSIAYVTLYRSTPRYAKPIGEN